MEIESTCLAQCRTEFVLAAIMVFICGCRTQEKAWIRAQSKDTYDSYHTFLETYPEGEFAERARLRANECLFAKAQAEDNPESYVSFLRQCPDGSLAERAKQRLEKIRHDTAINARTLEALNEFFSIR